MRGAGDRSQRSDAAGDRAQEGPDRVRGHQDARLGLGEAEGVDVVGEKRREGGEEHRVDEHHRAHQHDEPGLYPRSSGGAGPNFHGLSMVAPVAVSLGAG